MSTQLAALKTDLTPEERRRLKARAAELGVHQARLAGDLIRAGLPRKRRERKAA